MSRQTKWMILGLGALLVLGIGAAATIAADVPTASAETSLAVGDLAPDFTLSGSGDATVKLSSFRNKSNVVLIFYPRDFTSVCTRQLCQLRDDYAQFTELDAVGFGINDDPLDSHEKFQADNDFPFPLLMDPGLKVAAQYGAAQADQSFVDRTVVIVGKDGKVVFYAKGVPSTADMIAAIAPPAPAE